MKMEDGIVVAYEELSKEELLQLKSELEAQFDEVKAKNLKLDMSEVNRLQNSWTFPWIWWMY